MGNKVVKYNNEHYINGDESVAKHRRFHLVKAIKNGKLKKVPIYEIGDFITKPIFKRYRNLFAKINPFKRSKIAPVHGHIFGLGEVTKLISQPECHGIRIYYGLKKANKNEKEHWKGVLKEKGQDCKIEYVPQLMIVGVYKDGADMTDHTLILDASMPCPTYCDPT